MDRLRKLVLVLSILTLSGLTAYGQSFSFGLGLTGETVTNPTAIDIGPDQRIYVTEQSGLIRIYTVEKSGLFTYLVTDEEILDQVQSIQNHNDDGSVIDTVQQRQITGITVAGTVQNPVIYVSSSDYRIADEAEDLNLDTNSGTISRLVWNGESWDHTILVRGLPRSEENHSTNGLIYDAGSNVLYVAQGGNTNSGSPSSYAFQELCEFAYSAAILSVDMNVLDTMPTLIDTSSGFGYIYDLPTLDDPYRPNANGIDDPMTPGYNGIDIHDPFGGNDGLNQAKWTTNSPVQVYATGFRNPYDVLMTSAGTLYTWDNGPNPTWGGPPLNEGIGTSNNDFSFSNTGADVINMDGLHLLHQGYYGGHPNPIRCNPDSAGLYTELPDTTLWRTVYDPGNINNSLPYDWPPIDTNLANPMEGVYLEAGIEDSSIFVIDESTNGLAEYTASNFDGALQGDLLAVGLFTGRIYRVKLDSLGMVDTTDLEILIDLNGQPLDLAVMGDGSPFPGTVWVVRYGATSNNIFIYEPTDFSACEGDYDNNIDEDGDGYTNADEIDNGTNPCNAADAPNDFDGTYINGFKVSDLNDPDDDDDGINDTLDLYVLDSLNGVYTIPREFALFNSDPGTGFFALGFTGIMMNQTDDYLDLLFTPDEGDIDIIAGGAAGLLTYVGVDTGDALGTLNTQRNALHMGVQVDSTFDPFVVEVSLLGPVFTDTIQDFQSVGMYIGTGDQDNYAKLVVNANDSMPGIELVIESDGSYISEQFEAPGIDTVFQPGLIFIINPSNGFVQPQYRIDMGSALDLGNGFFLEGPAFDVLRDSSALAVGIISTARGSSNRFEASWDHISIRYTPIETRGHWIVTQDGQGCQPSGNTGSCCTARHETSFIQSGDKWYLLGGREDSRVEIYDPLSDIWNQGPVPPISNIHHFQAVDYHGLILVTGAMTGNIPSESNIDSILIYDPLDSLWYFGPEIPASRRRAASGCVIVDDTLYVLGGITNGHISGSSPWSDKFDIKTGVWTQLSDAPHMRDHFHAAPYDGKIYAIGGRQTDLGDLFGNTESAVDYFDIATQSWTTASDTLPTHRAGTTAAVLDNEILIIGGENGTSNLSNKETEAYNPATGTWRSLDTMNFGRNGTQVIVNNSGLYIATGARLRGGGQVTKTTEAYFMYGQTSPALVPSIQSSLTSPETVDMGVVVCDDSTRTKVHLINSGGTQAILVQSVSLSEGTVFSLDSTGPLPRIVKPGDTITLHLKLDPVAPGTQNDTLVITHSGQNAPESVVPLTGYSLTSWSGGSVIYVDSSATGNKSGANWTDAVTSVKTAVEMTACFELIEQVWIAGGTYYPGSYRDQSIEIPGGIALYGGFAGTESLLEERDPNVNPVTISGDIGQSAYAGDNSFNVMRMTNQTDTSFVHDIIISSGNANGIESVNQNGAGVSLVNSILMLQNIVIENCHATLPGSAASASGLNAELWLNAVTIRNNSDPVLANGNNARIYWTGNSIILD